MKNLTLNFIAMFASVVTIFGQVVPTSTHPAAAHPAAGDPHPAKADRHPAASGEIHPAFPANSKTNNTAAMFPLGTTNVVAAN